MQETRLEGRRPPPPPSLPRTVPWAAAVDRPLRPEDVQLFEKKKPDKNRKGSTKKGSRKEKKKSDEFDALPGSSAPLIPQQVFVGAGLGAVLFVLLLAVFMSGAMN